MPHHDREIWACILVGGQSRRMGEPKHLLVDEDVTWLESEVAIVEPLVDRVVLAGQAKIPDSLRRIVRLDDIAGVAGPLAGILAALRSNSAVDWLVLPCDMPWVNTAAINWLLAETRKIAAQIILPVLPDKEYIEPLFAVYRAEALTLIAQCCAQAEFSLQKIRYEAGVVELPVVAEHCQAWSNINTSQELDQYRRIRFADAS